MDSSRTDLLIEERPREGVRLLRLNRPDRRNAMVAELTQALHDALDEIAADRTCRAVIITGNGPAFCVGLDLAGYGAAPQNTGTDPARDSLANQEHMSRLVLK